MRIAYVFLFVVVAAGVSAAPKSYNLEDAPKLFEKFIQDNDRHYKDEADRQVHYDAFVNTLKYVNEENTKGHSYTLGITPFADQTEEERKQRTGGLIIPH